MSTTLIEKRQNGADLTKLPHQQQAFCLHMAASESFNSRDAAVKAGYKDPCRAANRLLQKPAIRRFLGKIKREREERTQLTSDKIWRYLHTVLYFNPVDFGEKMAGGWWAIDVDKLPEEYRQLINGIEVKSLRVSKDEYKLVTLVKFVDKSKALEVAAKHALPMEVNIHAQVAVAPLPAMIKPALRENEIEARLVEEQKLLEHSE